MKSLQITYDLSFQTFFLALHYLDTVCSQFNTFSFDETLQIAVLCVILAAKFNEQGCKAFDTERQLKRIINGNYKHDELYVLQLLNYELNVITCYDYVMMIMNFGFLFEGESFSKKEMNIIYNQLDKMVYAFCESKKYIEMSPKQIALGVIGFARESIGLTAFNGLLQIVFEFYDEERLNAVNEGLKKVKMCLKVKPTANSNNSSNSSTHNKIDCVQINKQIEEGILNNKMFMYAI